MGVGWEGTGAGCVAQADSSAMANKDEYAFILVPLGVIEGNKGADPAMLNSKFIRPICRRSSGFNLIFDVNVGINLDLRDDFYVKSRNLCAHTTRDP